MIREFFSGWSRWGLKVAWHNLRWSLGYRIGGFKHACDDPFCGED